MLIREKKFFKELEGDEMLCLSEITELDIYTEKFKNKKKSSNYS